ncbi:MAG: sensor histidine kinase [Candidatus Aminicenantales bacterium]
MEKRPLVLVIDDEESMRDSCAQILRRHGYYVELAADGQTGLERAAAIKPDIALIDLKMPGLSGFDVLDRIKTVDPEIISIVITGYATVESAVEAMKKGAYDFLPKPFTPEELRVIIRRALERRELAREAEKLRREKKLLEENFITLVSHQLRSPLVAIQQYFETILGGYAGEIPPTIKDMILRGRERLDNLLHLINDWLDLARINKNELITKFKPVSLEAMLRRQMETFKPLADENKISLSLEKGAGKDIILADEASLEQALANLIHNAIKYNRPGGSVFLRIRQVNGKVGVDIQDTGVGIPPEHLPFIFDQFYRVPGTGQGMTKGTGLGLSIAKKIIEAHDGTIEVVSEVDKGSTFTVILPTKEGK